MTKNSQLTPLQLLEQEQKKFADAFMEQKALGKQSNFAIISELLKDEYWKSYANIGTYQGARKVLDKYAPEWKNPK